jgi:CheY-like chemotaxis protein
MPVMDGFEATRRIRGDVESAGARTPIVALTADALAGDRERCLESGMDDYMTKPVRAAQLAAAVRRWAGSQPQLGASDAGRVNIARSPSASAPRRGPTR